MTRDHLLGCAAYMPPEDDKLDLRSKRRVQYPLGTPMRVHQADFDTYKAENARIEGDAQVRVFGARHAHT